MGDILYIDIFAPKFRANTWRLIAKDIRSLNSQSERPFNTLRWFSIF